MEKILLEFVSCCRADGLRISTAEVLDCLVQLEITGVGNPLVFHTILRANFAKSRREHSAFERLYRLFFHEMQKVKLLTEPEKDAAFPEPGGSPYTSDEMKALSTDIMDTDIDQALMDFIKGNPQVFIAAVRQIHDQESQTAQAVKSNLGQLNGRLEIMLAINKMRQRMARFLGGPDAHVVNGDRKYLEKKVSRRLDTAMAFLNEDPRPDNAGLRTAGANEKPYAGVGEIPFANLSRDEMNRVSEVVDQWVKKLAEMSTLRFSAARKGRMDVQKTIRRSGRYLGVPVEIVRKDRPLKKGKILTLCDVSGSVWSTARFMLGILYSLQSCFARVKSHVFIDHPVEVTSFFMAHDVNKAIEKILKHPGINYSAKTDYGLVFQTFKENHFQDLDKKTTLIIMGDARSNYFNPREPVLEVLRERCRRLIWLNPEQERFWGTGDSEMPLYSHHCNEVRPCGNLNQLIDFIQELVL